MTAHRSGATIQVPVACHKRPGRRACDGFVVAYRQDTPSLIRWECPMCGYGGVISGWERTAFDRRALEVERDESVERVELSLDLHSALRPLAERAAECAAVVYAAVVVDGRIALEVPGRLKATIAGHALAAALDSGGGTAGGRLIELATALGDRPAAGGDLVDLGLMPADLIEGLLADFDIVSAEVRPTPRRTPRGSKRGPHGDPRTFVLRVGLRDSVPPAWRRIEVSADIGLAGLHDVLQVAMGWTDSHLHAFRFGEQVYSPRDPDIEPLGEDTRGVRLSDVAARVGSAFVYEYDFGDGWEHDVVVEAIRDEVCRTPRCVGGANACPPEDCGGVWGYAEMLEALANPRHEAHDSYVEWLGGTFDPAAFDARKVDVALGRIRVRRS